MRHLRAGMFLAAVLALLGTAAAAAQAAPYITIEDAKLTRPDRGAPSVSAEVLFDRDGIAAGMTKGDVRLVALTAAEARAKVLWISPTYELTADGSTVRIDDVPLDTAAQRAAIAPGNRVVLTASQHGLALPGARSRRTYVTVAELQAGPPRTVGTVDCSDRAIVPQADLRHCDLVGATLRNAQVSTPGDGGDDAGTNVQYADLSGADLHGADLTRLRAGWTRFNGADASHAQFDRAAFFHVEGLAFKADDGDLDGADFIESDLSESSWEGAALKGTSFLRARLDDANLRTVITAADMVLASLRRADLRGATLDGAFLDLADLTDARLNGARVTVPDVTLRWATLCRTTMPGGRREDRDCPRPAPQPARSPFVTVTGTLQRDASSASISGSVHWNLAGVMSYGMLQGDVRAVAIDAGTGAATFLGAARYRLDESLTVPVTIKVVDPANPDPRDAERLAALRTGNRVVLTATQHGRTTDDRLSTRSYVTVAQLQAGPDRGGRVGSVDCADRPITPAAPADFCDLPGAAFRQADLEDAQLHKADLSGADMSRANMSAAVVSGGRMAGVDADGARADATFLQGVLAPGLVATRLQSVQANVLGSVLTNAQFDWSNTDNVEFKAADLTGATFGHAVMFHPEFAYSDPVGARFPNAELDESSFAFADVTGASFATATVTGDEQGLDPFRDARECQTTLPDGTRSDRDCPRQSTSAQTRQSE